MSVCVVSSPDYLRVSLLMLSGCFQQAGCLILQGEVIGPLGACGLVLPGVCGKARRVSRIRSLGALPPPSTCCYLCLKGPGLANFDWSSKCLIRHHFLQEAPWPSDWARSRLLPQPAGRTIYGASCLRLESLLTGQPHILRTYG